MKILAIESASVSASCAIMENGILLGEYTQCLKKTHSEKLMPLIEKLLVDSEVVLDEIDAIAVSKGPGSYTGIRIGASIGMGISFAKNIPMIEVPTIYSLASNVYDSLNYIVPVMDAKANRIYTGIYKWDCEELIQIEKQFPSDIDNLVEIVKKLDGKIVFLGDGSESYRNLLKEGLGEKAIFSPKYLNTLKASTTAWIGYNMYLKGEVVSCYDFTPDYLRLSQAERNKGV